VGREGTTCSSVRCAVAHSLQCAISRIPVGHIGCCREFSNPKFAVHRAWQMTANGASSVSATALERVLRQAFAKETAVTADS